MDHPEHSPSARVQHIAVGTYHVADRFPAYEEAFGNKLKNIATALIRDVAFHQVARTRDALGTNRLIHEILGNVEALKALLQFAKNRGVAPHASIDIVLWHLEQLCTHFRIEDTRTEQHAHAQHPQGALIFGEFTQPQPSLQPFTPFAPQPQPESFASQQQEPVVEQPLTRYDAPEKNPETQTFDRTAFSPRAVVNPAAARFTHLEAQTVSPVRTKPIPTFDETNLLENLPVGNDRQKRLLDFFALRRRAQLKDLLALFPDISEKTVRNDLAMLCRSGQLRRVGLAPRSHYVLTA